MKYILLPIFSIIFLQCTIPMQSSEARITEDELLAHISYLASDELEGRKPGSAGGKQAAAYIANHFMQLGLTPLGDNGYQYFEVITSVELGPNNSLASGDITGVVGENYTPTAFSTSTTLDAPVVFAGYGFQIENDSLNWDDYANQDVNGKWVMVLRGTPENDARESKFDKYAALRRKLLVARDNGAAGVIFVSGEKFDANDELINLRIERNLSTAALPVVHIKRDLVNQLVAATGKTVTDIETQLDTDQTPSSFDTGISLAITTEIIQNEVTTQNVVALLPANDPELKDEYIVVGSHYDHLGWGGKGSGSRRPDTSAVHNGADDNASGVAAVLEIAENLALKKNGLRRNVVFVTFGAEEMGLLGSKFFTSNPLIDLKNVKQMFNLDMIGRLNPETKSLTVGGTGTAKGLEDYLKANAQDRAFNLAVTPDGYGPSDHAAFYVEDIPVLFFFTGITEEYHTPQDDVSTINFPGEKMIAEFAADLIIDMSNMDESFEFQEAGPKGPPKSGKRGKVKMGIIPDFAASNTDGFLLGGIVPGGPASSAGLLKGDVMVALEGRSVKNVYDYMGRMADVKPGQRITVEVMRGDEKIIVIVQL